MKGFDYDAEAELFPSRTRTSRRQPIGYKRFSRAADAIRFAMEELPEEFLSGAYLEVAEERFDRHDMADLYRSAEYPLPRRKAEMPAKQGGARDPGTAVQGTGSARPANKITDSRRS